jgi:hypothetical protein
VPHVDWHVHKAELIGLCHAQQLGRSAIDVDTSSNGISSGLIIAKSSLQCEARGDLSVQLVSTCTAGIATL